MKNKMKTMQKGGLDAQSYLWLPPQQTSMKHRAAIQGLTLVELLIGLAVASIVLTFIGYAVQNVTVSTAQAMASANLQRESQIAQQVLTGRINNAVYIYHDGVLKINSEQSVTTLNPDTGSNSWTIGTHPIIATIQPPPKPNSGTDDACYQFMAFYPVSREKLQELSSAAQRPQKDSANNDKWVLMQYQRAIKDDTGNCWDPDWDPKSGALRAAVPRVYSSSQGRMLADYMKPNTKIPETGETKNTNVSVKINKPSPNTDATKPALSTQLGKKDGSVTFAFQLERAGVGGSPAGALISNTVVPRNWTCPNEDQCDNAK